MSAHASGREEYRSRTARTAGLSPVRSDPDQAAAEELSSWAEGKLTRLGGQPTREAVWGAMLLLQKRFFLLRRRSQEPSWQPLMVVYERYYDRLELVLEDADPPLPMASGPSPAPPTEAGVELFEDA